MAFHLFGRLSGLVPLVGITSGCCFAGNAALLGCCDVVIATADANIGMGGPAMVEGGGLGVFAPDDIGPMTCRCRTAWSTSPVRRRGRGRRGRQAVPLVLPEPADGVDGARPARAARRRPREPAARVRRPRRHRRRSPTPAPCSSCAPAFGAGMVTALARIEGRPVGIVANNPTHLGGAIDADGADKAARFMQLCDAFDLPVLFLCDTPGFMVGPEAETDRRWCATSAACSSPART